MLQLHDVMALAHNHLAELLLQSHGVQSKMIRSPGTKRQTVQLTCNFPLRLGSLSQLSIAILPVEEVNLRVPCTVCYTAHLLHR